MRGRRVVPQASTAGDDQDSGGPVKRIVRTSVWAVAGCMVMSTLFGCEPPPSKGILGRRTMQIQGVLRGCLIYVPRAAKVPAPVVFNLHGYGSYAAMQMEHSGMNAVADTAGFIVVYPNAFEHKWNSGIADNPLWPTPAVDDVGFIDALIDTLATQFSIDLERIYVCGMSNGGFMSYRLACRLSHRIRGAASVAGTLSRATALDCDPERPIPLLHIHGTADATVPYDGAPGWCSAEESAKRWANLNECVRSDTTELIDSDPSDGCTITKIDCVDSSGNADVVFYRVNGGGHTWPGATREDPGAGATSRDLNASEEIWRFFESQEKRDLPARAAATTP